MTPRDAAGRIRLHVRDLRTIALGRRHDGRRRSLTASGHDLATVWAMWRAHRSGNGQAALGAARDLLRAHPELLAALTVESGVGIARGEVTEPLAATVRLRRLADRPALATRERLLRSRLIESDPGWLPTIDGPPRPLTPRSSPTTVMHLLKASLPIRQSGYTIRSRETLRAQLAAGLQPFVVTPYGYPPADDDPPQPGDDVETVDGVVHHRLCPGCDTADLGPEAILERTAAAAADVAIRERPALIQAASGHRGYEMALVALALRQHLRRPVVYEVRGFLEATWTADAELADSAELTRRRLATEARVMVAVDGITTLSEAMRDELVARGAAPDRIAVMPNGIDPDAMVPGPRDPELVARYGLDGRWVFGYVSNMDHPREGQEQLIDAAVRMVRAGRAVTCLLVGDGTRRASLEARARASGVPEAVVFTGRVPHEEVAAHYALLDAFVVPRLPDRAARFVTPLKPYEAMAMGLPLVVSDLPALTEIAAPGERGLAFPSGSTEALVSILGRLMDDPVLGSRLAAEGRRWVVAERTWSAVGARYRDFYASVLERSDPASWDVPSAPLTASS